MLCKIIKERPVGTPYILAFQAVEGFLTSIGKFAPSVVEVILQLVHFSIFVGQSCLKFVVQSLFEIKFSSHIFVVKLIQFDTSFFLA